MNAGHVQLCLGNKTKALEYYSRSLKSDSFSTDLFIAGFEEDFPNLVKNGIPEKELPLILDYLLFQNQ
jgi:hypothetical protein